MTRALAMVSGGLDSILAAKLIKDQGIEVIGICFKSYFFNEENAKRMCKQIDMPLEVVDFSEEHFEMVKDPKHGRGKNMNPCIDCHAMMMRYSGELLKKFDADFIITGEVLNQRPMSQNRQALNTVKKESGFIASPDGMSRGIGLTIVIVRPGESSFIRMISGPNVISDIILNSNNGESKTSFLNADLKISKESSDISWKSMDTLSLVRPASEQ